MSFLVYDDQADTESHEYENTPQKAIRSASRRNRQRLPQPGESYGLREVGEWTQYEVTGGTFKIAEQKFE